jgi:hypothetical protein
MTADAWARGLCMGIAVADDRMKLELRPAWRRNDPDLARDVIAFWRRLDVVSIDSTLEERIQALCLVAYRNGEVVGVSSAFLQYNSMLRARLAMFRCVIAPRHRRGLVVAELAEGSRLLLMDWARANPQEKLKGMGAVSEPQGTDSMRFNPIWRYKDLRLILVGWTRDGHPMRVAWFPGVRLEPDGGRPAPQK